MKRISMLKILTLYIFLCVPATSADLFINAMQTIKRSLVPVACFETTDPNSIKIKLLVGTGFFINDDSFVTAAHVIDTARKECELTAICLPIGRQWKSGEDVKLNWFRFDRCRANNLLDLAVCQMTETIPNDIRPTPVVFSDTAVPDGTAVATTGFPLQIVQPITSRAFVAGYLNLGAPTSEILLDNGSWPGASGSPVYDERGYVVGMMVKRSLAAATGISYARTGKAIQGWLASLDIKTEAPK